MALIRRERVPRSPLVPSPSPAFAVAVAEMIGPGDQGQGGQRVAHPNRRPGDGLSAAAEDRRRTVLGRGGGLGWHYFAVRPLAAARPVPGSALCPKLGSVMSKRKPGNAGGVRNVERGMGVRLCFGAVFCGWSCGLAGCQGYVLVGAEAVGCVARVPSSRACRERKGAGPGCALCFLLGVTWLLGRVRLGLWRWVWGRKLYTKPIQPKIPTWPQLTSPFSV